MALFQPILGQISGSIAGDTFSHNKSGQYIRQRTIPTNPNSVWQQFYRGTFAGAVSRWKGLAPAVREAWAVYAANTPTTNRLGATIYLDALNWYVAVNVLRVPAGIGYLDAAPVIFGLSGITPPTIAISEATQICTVTFDNSDEWAVADDGFLVVQQGLPQSGSINYFRGPYRPQQFILGNTAVPPTSPDATGSLQWQVVEDQMAFYRFRACSADGRITPAVQANVVVAA